MVEITSKSGKKLMSLSDTVNGEDTIFIDGKKANLEDAYNNLEVKDKFNDTVKKIKIEDDNSKPKVEDDK